MPEQLPQQSVSDVAADPIMRRFREYVAAIISLTIIIGTVVMMIIALNHVDAPDERFTRVKDLLLFINPLLGVVVGYYFNKVTSEARAETAETTAQSAMASAQLAAEARNAADTEAKTAKGEAEEAKSALKEVGEAAEKMAAQAPAATTLGVDESGEPIEDPRLEFKMAWSRAKRLLE
jgi:hypothetical protein